MKNKDLAKVLLENPENDVKVLVEGKWYLTTEIKEVKDKHSLTAIIVNNPETRENNE
jgi:hypothetical protein